MNEEPIVPESECVQHTTADSGTPESGPAVPTRDSTRAFAPVGTTPPMDGTRPSWPAETLVGKYRVLEPIGGGGMGFVYRALNPDLGCPVALKVIRAGELASPESRQRFERECQALARFRHANIVTVHDAGQHQGQPFLVMEYLGGGSLARNLARFQCDPRAAVALIEKVARAVQQLHTEGVLHRDLKPANVLLDDDGEPRVGDFGLVKLLDSADELTGTGHCPGTAPYMAPEQTGLLAQPLGPPTDVWALGVMLYELLLGGRPFTAPERPALFHQIVAREPVRPRVLCRRVDAGLEAVLLKCLEKDPTRRFATAGELADELGRWLRSEPLRTTPPGRLRRLIQTAQRRPLLATLGLVAGLAVAGALLAYLVIDSDRESRTIHNELRSGKPVVLIPERGQPTWSKALLGRPVPSHEDEGGYFTLQGWGQVLLALVRTPPCPEYRLRAKVRHLRGGPAPRVGMFIGYHAVPTPHGEAHLCQRFHYSDAMDHAEAFKPQGKPAAPNPAELDLWLTADIGAARPRTGKSSLGNVRFRPPPKAPPGWRQLEIAVGADRIEATFDGRALAPCGVPTLERHTSSLLTDLAKRDPVQQGFFARVDPAFDRAGAIGIYVEDSVAAFSDVVIIPSVAP